MRVDIFLCFFFILRYCIIEYGVGRPTWRCDVVGWNNVLIVVRMALFSRWQNYGESGGQLPCREKSRTPVRNCLPVAVVLLVLLCLFCRGQRQDRCRPGLDSPWQLTIFQDGVARCFLRREAILARYRPRKMGRRLLGIRWPASPSAAVRGRCCCISACGSGGRT